MYRMLNALCRHVQRAKSGIIMRKGACNAEVCAFLVAFFIVLTAFTGKSRLLPARGLPGFINGTDEVRRTTLERASFSRRSKAHHEFAADISLIRRSTLEARAGSGGCKPIHMPRPAAIELNIDPNRFLGQDGVAEGPTAQELADTPEVMREFQV